MRRRLILAGVIAAAGLGLALPSAQAAGQACVEVQANVNGTPVGVPLTCVDVPDLPSAP